MSKEHHGAHDQLAQDLLPHALHHTYVLVGNREELLAGLRTFLQSNFSMHSNNPDLWVKEFDSIGVDDVADVIVVHQRKPLGNKPASKKIIILATSQITTQAQNSLLKMLEEPSERTHFFIIMPTSVQLLPTVLSRAHVLSYDTENGGYRKDKDSLNDRSSSLHTARAGDFLNAAVPERLEMVADILAEYDKEKIKREDICQFVSEVEHAAYVYFISTNSNDREQALQTIEKAQEYVRDTSSSLKLILEYLALTMPRT